jgi:hypothetical protein
MLRVQFGLLLDVHVFDAKLTLLVVPAGQPWGSRDGQFPNSADDRAERQDARTNIKRRKDESIGRKEQWGHGLAQCTYYTAVTDSLSRNRSRSFFNYFSFFEVISPTW